jgi:hypothetical protein
MKGNLKVVNVCIAQRVGGAGRGHLSCSRFKSASGSSIHLPAQDSVVCVIHRVCEHHRAWQVLTQYNSSTLSLLIERGLYYTRRANQMQPVSWRARTAEQAHSARHAIQGVPQPPHPCTQNSSVKAWLIYMDYTHEIPNIRKSMSFCPMQGANTSSHHRRRTGRQNLAEWGRSVKCVRGVDRLVAPLEQLACADRHSEICQGENMD